MEFPAHAKAVLPTLALALVVAAGCSGRPGTTHPPISIAQPLPSALVGPTGGGILSNNAGSLTGQVFAPSATLINGYGSKVISDGGAAVLSNHGGGLIGQTKARRVLDLPALLTPLVGASVTVVDAHGASLVDAPVTSDATGHFSFARLHPSSGLVFVRADLDVSGIHVQLLSAAPAPRQAAVSRLLDPATTLVAKHLLAASAAGTLAVETLDVDAVDQVAAAIRPTLDDAHLVAASVLAPAPAAKVLDDLLDSKPALASQVQTIVKTSGKPDFTARIPSTAPSPSAAVSAAPSALPASPLVPLPSVAPLPPPVAALSPAPSPSIAPGYRVTTIAGTATDVPQDGQGAAARFDQPQGVAVDASGNAYVADTVHHAIRMVTPDGTVTTLAGNGTTGLVDGPGASARFDHPWAVALHAGMLYVADTYNAAVRRIDLSSAAHTVSTVAGGKAGYADGPAATAKLAGAYGIAVSANGTIYLAETYANRLRAIAPDGTVSTLAGAAGTRGMVDGDARTAQFNLPRGLAFDPQGNLVVADSGNHAIRRVNLGDPLHPSVDLIAGGAAAGTADGVGAAAQFIYPVGVAVDGGGTVYVTEVGATGVRKITPDYHVSHLTTSLVPANAPGLAAPYDYDGPVGVALRPQGDLLVADPADGQLIRIDAGGQSSSLAGSLSLAYADGVGAAAHFWHPYGIALDAAGTLYVADTENNRIRKLAGTASGSATVTTWAGSGVSGYLDGPGASAALKLPYGLAAAPDGTLYVADAANLRVRKVAPDGAVSTLAGSGVAGHADGPGASASFGILRGVALDRAGNVYVSDISYGQVRKIAPDGTVSTLAGSTPGFADGKGTAARFVGPAGLAVDPTGVVYVADAQNCRIRRIMPDGTVDTIAGNGTSGVADGPGASATFTTPWGLALDASNHLYVADAYGGRIRRIDVADPAHPVTTLAGGAQGSADGAGAQAGFFIPTALVVGPDGKVYVADTDNNTIRRVDP